MKSQKKSLNDLARDENVLLVKTESLGTFNGGAMSKKPKFSREPINFRGFVGGFLWMGVAPAAFGVAGFWGYITKENGKDVLYEGLEGGIRGVNKVHQVLTAGSHSEATQAVLD